MNKSAIQKYAIWARNELIDKVTLKAFEYGVLKDEIIDANADSVNGKILTSKEKTQRQQLISKVNELGFDETIEEVAYTWFNRFIALRFMEVNNYLPTRIRVFTNENNEFKPEILKEAINLEFEGLDKKRIYMHFQANDTEELYKYILISQCNDMGKYLPGMFTKISDYKVLLFPDNLLRPDSVIGRLISDIDEDSWLDQVQIIGWMYQYYNLELFNSIYDGDMSKHNVEKNMLPAATGLFTPDWVARIMVENSLGRLWLDSRGEASKEWKYLINNKDEKQFLSDIPINQIKVLDPCMGSGHILVCAFDVLMDIYREKGYTDRIAAKSILENNIYGLEIDTRAYQLAYFALMMKARSYNRKILFENIKMNLIDLVETNGIHKDNIFNLFENNRDIAERVFNAFTNAKEFGSIIKLEFTQEELAILRESLENIEKNIPDNLIDYVIYDECINLFSRLIDQLEIMIQKYHVVITNPPYLGSGRFTNELSAYVTKYHNVAKQDLSTVILKNMLDNFVMDSGYISIVSTVSWMFIQRFESLRKYVFEKASFVNIVDYGTELFDGKIGHLPIASYVLKKMPNIKSDFISIRLVNFNYSNRNEKEKEFFNKKNYFVSNQETFKELPGNPVAYWCSKRIANLFVSSKKIFDYAESRAGIVTGNDSYFIRLWHEINYLEFSRFGRDNYLKYHIMQKGGECCFYYGNYEYVLKLQDLYNDKYVNKSVRRGDQSMYFKKGIGWSQVGNNSNKSFRYIEHSVCGTATPTIYLKQDCYYYYFLGFLNTKITRKILDILNPTINLLTTDVLNLPIIIKFDFLDDITSCVKDCVEVSKQSWNSFETSWDFTVHPLVKNHVSTVSEAYSLWAKECDDRFNQLKANEEELNRIFIDIYGLQDELDPYVEDKDVTVRKADLERDVRSMISYAVGCMFGRYSLDVQGLTYAGGEFDWSKYQSFVPDKDNIIPICDDEYFEDDIVGRFIKFIEVVYGESTLDENLSFIASALGGKGNPREVIRSYFLNDFYKDHCKIYQKRPIYWLFDSGKKNGFKALMYIHRYQPDLIARLRTDYVHETQSRLNHSIEMINTQLDGDLTSSEKVRLNKELTKFKAQAEEVKKYEEIVHHWADKMEPMDLDDGVKVNYEKFKDLLAKIK